MNDQQWLDVIRTEGMGFAACIDRGPLDRRVPGCPDWDLAGLADHLGFIHRNVARTVREPATGKMRWLPVSPPGSSTPLGRWIAEGVDELLDALRGDPEDEVATFVGPRPRRWWWRRQAHETAVHHWDAASALGRPEPLDPDLAVDGIDELFEVFIRRIPVERFGGDGATLHLHATDTAGEWLVRFDADELRVEREHRKGDVAARGSASDLLLFLYGRVPATGLEVFGDGTVLQRWRSAVDV
jgi:uncharacterized protein (TIGR03083 family)